MTHCRYPYPAVDEFPPLTPWVRWSGAIASYAVGYAHLAAFLSHRDPWLDVTPATVVTFP